MLEIDSTHAPTLFELATLTMSGARNRPPVQSAGQCRRHGNIWYRTQLGRLLIATAYDSAMTVYNSLLKAAPNNPDNYRLIAMLYEQKGDPEKALIILDSAERQLGAVEMLAGYKRQLLLNMKQYDRALVEAKAMVENFPYDEDNYVELAELYTTLGQLAQAQEAYRKAQEINPNSLRVIASLNDFYKRTNDNVRFLSTAAQLFRSKRISARNETEIFGRTHPNAELLPRLLRPTRELVFVAGDHLSRRLPDGRTVRQTPDRRRISGRRASLSNPT